MQVEIFENADAITEKALKIFLEALQIKKNLVVGLPTGRTPLQLYKKLIEQYKQKNISFKEVSTFNLDEYVGLNSDDKWSFQYYMNENFFRHIDLSPQNCFFPLLAGHPKVAAREFEEEIEKRGGLDLTFVGIGPNGHIGYNEPGSNKNTRTRIVLLSNETVEYNRRSFKKSKFQPIEAATMGIATILESRCIVLIANGEIKAAAVKQALEGNIGPQCPASFLREHPNAIFLLDKEASSLLSKKNDQAV